MVFPLLFLGVLCSSYLNATEAFPLLYRIFNKFAGMKSFDVPVVYRSSLISSIKKKRKEEDDDDDDVEEDEEVA